MSFYFKTLGSSRLSRAVDMESVERINHDIWKTEHFCCNSNWRKYRYGSFRGVWTLLLLNDYLLHCYTQLLMKVSRRRSPKHFVHDAALTKNLSQLNTSGRWRVERLLLHLQCFAPITFEEKVISIGGRSLFDYTLLMAHGWRRRNIYPVDVIGLFKQVRTMSVEKLSYSDESFDLAVCSAVMPYVQRRKEAVSEIKRVLRPGGYLMAYENAVPKSTYSDLSANPWITEFEPYSGHCNSGKLVYYEKALLGEQGNSVIWLIWQKVERA